MSQSTLPESSDKSVENSPSNNISLIQDLFADMLTEVAQSKKSPQPSTQSPPLPQLESQVIPNLLPPPPPPPPLPQPTPQQSSQSVISPPSLPLSQSQQQSNTQPQLQPQQATSSTTNNNEQQKAQNDLTQLGNNNNPILSNMKRPVHQESSKSGSTSNSIQKSNNVNSPSKNQPKYLLNSFNWITLLERDHDMSVASVSSFRHCPMSQVWNSLITVGLKVEVKNRDVALPKSPRPKQDYYWIASVVKVSGYFVLLRFEGFDTDGTKDFWLNLFSNQLHPIGWCASQGKVLIPPRMIADKYSDWKAVLVKRLTGGRTLPENFFDQVKESMKSRFRVGMVLECVDKTRLSAVRVATIDKIIGNRLHLNYEGENEDNSGFWCHENSPLIHPIGWAQVVGHELKATQEYARSSLEKTIHKTFDDNDAYWSLFPVQRPHPTVNMADYRFSEGMKLEAIDPLNLSNICVATVTKVLRNHFLMVGIDGMMANDGSDWFCYHVLSPNIFPAGFCMLNNIPLTPPRGYNREFNWFEYLQETKSRAAPVHLFKKDIPVHGFKEGMLIEAVDLMVPRLICVATIIKVVGRLLKIHFNGWDETYDQWCDCESPELYPIGWCQMVGYPLEPPRESDAGDTHMTTYSSALDGRSKKRNIYKGRHKKRRRGGLNVSSSSDNSQVTLSNTNDRASTSDFMESFSSPYSPYNYDWSQQTGTSSSPPTSTSFANESNSSVIVKPSPVQPIIIQEPTSSNPSLTTTSSSKRSTDPRQWSITDVCNFLRSKDHGNHVQSFARAQINGSRLLQLTTDEVLELTNKKLGPSLKIYALIQSLKGIKPQ